MSTENKENYGQEDRNFQTTESSVNETHLDENTSYVDQYENISTENNPEEETVVNKDDSVTNDQDNLDQQFLDALQEDAEEENNTDQNNVDKGDPNADADDDSNLDTDDFYENEDADDLADNDLNDLEGDHLNNPELDQEEHNIRNRDSSKID
jgi:hypothetical protein